jgi:hypothetical protein
MRWVHGRVDCRARFDNAIVASVFSRNQKMQRSTERILTTHVGSLPRPDDLFELMLARMDGNAIDEQAYAERVRNAVRDCVGQQVDAGLDIVSDGEMGMPSFITYAASRLSGLEKREGFRPSPFANTRETRDFPEYYKSAVAEQVSARRRRALMVCAGPILLQKSVLQGAFGAEGIFELSRGDGFAPAPCRSGGADALDRYATH